MSIKTCISFTIFCTLSALILSGSHLWHGPYLKLMTSPNPPKHPPHYASKKKQPTTHKKKSHCFINLHGVANVLCHFSGIRIFSRSGLWSSARTPSSPGETSRAANPAHKHTEHIWAGNSQTRSAVCECGSDNVCGRRMTECIAFLFVKRRFRLYVFMCNGEQYQQIKNVMYHVCVIWNMKCSSRR